MSTKRKPNQIVKSCYKMESGLRLGQEGIHACQLGPFSSPIYFTEEEASKNSVTKEAIIEKREWIFELLNDPYAETPCKGCSMVVEKPFKEVSFDHLGHIDLAATTTCNLRCNFCGYTHFDSFDEAKYDALSILRQFETEDVTWNSAVDFNGGEPTLLKDFDEYIEYFQSRKTRVFLFTNGLIFKQSVYDGLIDGAVRWAIVSLDAGTKSTYRKMKLSPKFDVVLENIARYSEAGSKGGGNCAVKYIFHEDNSNDDDILGFCYAMLALRPQEVWLTFDFDPLCNLPADSDDLGGYDYSPHIEAYAKTYLLLEKHGLQAVHYAEKHLAPASKHGVILLQKVKEKISKLRRQHPPSLGLENFRSTAQSATSSPDCHFRIRKNKIEVLDNNVWHEEEFRGKNVVVAPASPQIKEFVALLENVGAKVTAIVDRDQVLHGKIINQIPIIDYHELRNYDVSVALVATTNTVIEPLIISQIRENTDGCLIHSFWLETFAEHDRPTTVNNGNIELDTQDESAKDQKITAAATVENLIRWARHTSG